MIKLAVLASGNGSNATRIYNYFLSSKTASVVGVFSNKSEAPVLEKINDLGGYSAHFTSNDELLLLLEKNDVEAVVLAGYLKLIPEVILEKFEDKVINIHPSLLPKFGGKGMYGMRVHQSVKEAGETETGITVHLVNKEYDKGEIKCQMKVEVLASHSAEDIAKNVQDLEHTYFPVIIEKILKNEL